MINKKFSVKIYQPDGVTLIKTLKPTEIKNFPVFNSQINGGFGQCIIDLNTQFDNFGAEISAGNIAKIYVMDANNPLGRLVYSGFISNFEPYLQAAIQGVKVNLLGLVSLLSFDYYKNGSSYTVAHANEDPAVVMKAIIDHFNTVYTGNLLGYDSGGTTIDTVGEDITYTFADDKWIEAIKSTFENVPADWWWTIDQFGQLYLKPKPLTATHVFTIGKDLESASAQRNSEKIINKVQVRYVGGGTVTVTDAPSIAAFGSRGSIINDPKIQDLATATIQGQKEVDDNKSEKIRSKITVNSNYDIESIKVGDTCKIRNIAVGQTTFGDNMQIVSVAYNFDKVTLELEQLSTFATELESLI